MQLDFITHANFNFFCCSFTIDVEIGENIEDAKKEYSLKSGITITFQ